MPLYHANATFDFESARDFLDCLTSIKHSLLCKLRHISVVGGAIRIKHAHPGPSKVNWRSKLHTFDAILPLLPGLRLSTLTIYEDHHTSNDPFDLNDAYAFVSQYIQAQGFKRLICISANDQLLDTVHSAEPGEIDPLHPGYNIQSHRDPQPSTWDAMIKQRDGGPESDANVQLFKICGGHRVQRPWIDPHANLQMYRPCRVGHRVAVTTRPGSRETAAADQTDTSDWRGHFEIIITRGKHARYVQEGGRQLRQEDQCLSDLFRELGWTGIRRLRLFG
ncbi:MAG: hypothetical protein Q9182_003753 [Xanthomendoza sp. 2 TL-2023]